VDWRGQIEAPTDGEYAFGLRVNGSAQVFIDDQLVVDAPEPTEYTEGKLSLSAGPHKIQIKFVDHLGGSRLHLYWTPPDDEKQIVPSDVLLPYP
jgi:hypothetical protein